MRKSIVTILEPTGPVYDLTTVDEVNETLGLTSNTADDAVTADQITSASRMIADLCNRNFALLTVSESFRLGWGDQARALNLAQFPNVEITSVTVGGTAIETTSYEVDPDAGLLYHLGGHWCGEVVALYSGGYDLPEQAPDLLSQACVSLVAAQKLAPTTMASDPNLREVQHGDSRVMYFGPTVVGAASGPVPSSVNELITPFKRLAV